jgi:A/G-specific adenine glycosylase
MTGQTQPKSSKYGSPVGRSLLSDCDWHRLRIWYGKHGRRLPWRNSATPWSILLAETLLHRTGANVVQALYPLIRKAFPSPKSVVLKTDQWTNMLHKGGLFWRARIFVSACEVLVQRHGGDVPSERRQLESLPGVGHYTASAVRCFGFGHREFITDTNTIRLVGRIAGKRLNPANHRTKSVQTLVAQLSDKGRPPVAEDNYALLDLAATVCKPQIPMCHKCPLRSHCHMAQDSKGIKAAQS